MAVKESFRPVGLPMVVSWLRVFFQLQKSDDIEVNKKGVSTPQYHSAIDDAAEFQAKRTIKPEKVLY